MNAMASQIIVVPIVDSTVCSGTDQRKHKKSASLAFVRGIQQWPVGPVTRKMFPFDDDIMQRRDKLVTEPVMIEFCDTYGLPGLTI